MQPTTTQQMETNALLAQIFLPSSNKLIPNRFAAAAEAAVCMAKCSGQCHGML